MNADLLMKLVKMLEADALKTDGVKFDLGCVVEFPDLEVQGDEVVALKYPEGRPPIAMDCNTSACAMGLAMLSGEFPRLGYEVVHHRNNMGELAMVRVIPTVDRQLSAYDKAAVEIFDINPHEANYLFNPACYSGQLIIGADGERQVAGRIKRFIATDGASAADYYGN